MKNENTFEVQVQSFKRMEDPTDSSSEKMKYVCYAQAKSISSDFDNWMGTNPREQKMSTNVARTIADSLKTNVNFHELNRGILLSASSVSYDNKTNIAKIIFEDPELHGNIDGGHTLRAILDAKSCNNLSDDRYVFVEIFTGLESPVDLAAARNTSVQVDLKSIEELKDSFEVIKEVYGSLPFSDRIAYKMNEHYNDSEIVPIDIREIIAITIMFSQEIYNIKTSHGTLSETQPIQCYSGKEASLRKFLNLEKEDSR